MTDPNMKPHAHRTKPSLERQSGCHYIDSRSLFVCLRRNDN